MTQQGQPSFRRKGPPAPEGLRERIRALVEARRSIRGVADELGTSVTMIEDVLTGSPVRPAAVARLSRAVEGVR